MLLLVYTASKRDGNRSVSPAQGQTSRFLLSSIPVNVPATLTCFVKLLFIPANNGPHWLVRRRMNASPTAQGRTQGSMFTLSCASPSSLPSGTSLPSWSCIGTGARSPSTSATRRSVRTRQNTPRGRNWSRAPRTTVSLVFTLIWICLRLLLNFSGFSSMWKNFIMLFVSKDFLLRLLYRLLKQV